MYVGAWLFSEESLCKESFNHMSSVWSVLWQKRISLLLHFHGNWENWSDSFNYTSHRTLLMFFFFWSDVKFLSSMCSVPIRSKCPSCIIPTVMEKLLKFWKWISRPWNSLCSMAKGHGIYLVKKMENSWKFYERVENVFIVNLLCFLQKKCLFL